MCHKKEISEFMLLFTDYENREIENNLLYQDQKIHVSFYPVTFDIT